MRSGLKRIRELKVSYRRPANKTEAEFFKEARLAGWTPTKKGWPDFLMFRDGARYCAVEVKPSSPILSWHQNVVMGLLEKAGLECWVWTPKTGFLRYGHHAIRVQRLIAHSRPANRTAGKRRKAINKAQALLDRIDERRGRQLRKERQARQERRREAAMKSGGSQSPEAVLKIAGSDHELSCIGLKGRGFQCDCKATPQGSTHHGWPVSTQADATP